MTPRARAARIFRLFSVETRIRILGLLRDQRMCVNALASRLGITAPAVSQHLRLLKDAGVVVADKRGYFVHYSINEREVASWGKVLESVTGVPGPR